MRFYHCIRCDSLMDEYEATSSRIEYHPEVDSRRYEIVSELRCIYCNSYDLEEADECDECGNLFPKDELDENWLCPECSKKETRPCVSGTWTGDEKEELLHQRRL